MKGDKKIVELLNDYLTAELTVINQYFLHAKMQENWGYHRLAEHTRKESIDEMRHADALTERILFLDGLPNYQRLGTLAIGHTVPEQLRSDLDAELDAVKTLRTGIQAARSAGDVTSALLLEHLLTDEEEHVDYLETQLALIAALGEPLYLSTLTEGPD